MGSMLKRSAIRALRSGVVAPYGGRMFIGHWPVAARMALAVSIICLSRPSGVILVTAVWSHVWSAISWPSAKARLTMGVPHVVETSLPST